MPPFSTMTSVYLAPPVDITMLAVAEGVGPPPNPPPAAPPPADAAALPIVVFELELVMVVVWPLMVVSMPPAAPELPAPPLLAVRACVC